MIGAFAIVHLNSLLWGNKTCTTIWNPSQRDSGSWQRGIWESTFCRSPKSKMNENSQRYLGELIFSSSVLEEQDIMSIFVCLKSTYPRWMRRTGCIRDLYYEYLPYRYLQSGYEDRHMMIMTPKPHILTSCDDNFFNPADGSNFSCEALSLCKIAELRSDERVL